MILVIDNYDSFTYNLVQLIAQESEDYHVVRNDQITVDKIRTMTPEGIIISPGPGKPENAGICVDLIRTLGHAIPILGVCLGHQAIGVAFGCTIIPAPTLMHGKTSSVRHSADGIFRDIANPFIATRYHSLVIERHSIPSSLLVTAVTPDATVMGVRHRVHPIEGVQFHPESILTTTGPGLIKNWIRYTRSTP